MFEKLLEPARHEPRDIAMRFIWIGVCVLCASVVLLAVIVLLLFPNATIDRTLHLPLPDYPQPRLQTDDRGDMQRFYAEEMTKLNSSGRIDQAGVAHIPIAQAMRLVAERQIAGWPGAEPQPGPAQTQTPASAPAASTEKTHGAAPAHPVAHRAGKRLCWFDARHHRHCLRTKARRAPAARKGVS